MSRISIYIKTLKSISLAKLLSILFFIFTFIGNSQNLLTNGDFETGDLTGWTGFTNQVLTDDITSSYVGNVNNGEGSLRKDVALIAGMAYTLKFDYRWVSGAGNYDMIFRIINDSNGDIIEELTLNQEPDVWFETVTIHFVVPANETTLRFVWYKIAGNRPFRLDNVELTTFDENLINNSGFETGTPGNPAASWGGFKNRIATDDIDPTQVGQVENGDGSLYQEFAVTPGETYDVNFDYRWDGSAGATNSDMIIRVKEVGNLSKNLTLIDANTQDGAGYTLNTTLDLWLSGSFSFTVPTGINNVRLLFFKTNDNKPLNLDNVFVEKRIAPHNLDQIARASQSSLFQWDTSTSEFDGYEWVITNTGDNPDIPNQIITDGQLASGINELFVNNLTDGLDYDLFLRTRYEDPDNVGEALLSKWTKPLNFTTGFDGNLVKNSRFEDDEVSTGNPADWIGFNHQSLVDNQIGYLVGNINNGEGSIFQIIDVCPGVEYALSFDYRWVSGSGNYNMNTVVRNEATDQIIESITLNTTPDEWFSKTLLFTPAIDQKQIRVLFYKANGNRPLRLKNVSVVENKDTSSDADYVFKNGSWSPVSPIGNSTNLDDILIFNGRTTFSGNVEANNIIIKPWSTLDIESVLTLEDTLIVEEGALVTFKNGNSVLGQLASGSVSGEVITERFVPAQTNNRRAYRYVTSSVNSSASIHDNWQEKGRNNIDHFGTHISGSQSGTNGFDATETGTPSMYTYDVISDNWYSIPNTDNTNLKIGKGYILLVRGDRQHDLYSFPANDPNADVVLRARGDLLSGSLTTGIDLPSLATNAEKFSLVGNPYQAILDFSLTNRTNLTDYIYVWDANLAGNNGVGGYVTVDLTDNIAPSPSGSTASKYLAPGQSVFVQNTSSGNGSITFEESDKATSESQVEVFNSYTEFYINSRLYKTQDLNDGHTECDAIGLRFSSNYITEADEEDALKFFNNTESYSILNNGYRSIDKQNIPENNHTVNLNIQNYLATEYSLTFNLINKPENLKVFLKDNYLNTLNELNNHSVYNFIVDENIPDNISEIRFQLLFKNTNLSIEDLSEECDFYLFPNPVVNGSFSIKSKKVYTNKSDIEIFNATGKKVMTKRVDLSSADETDFRVKHLSSGVYLVKLKTEGNRQ